MTLRRYKELIDQMARDSRNLELEVWYSSDDEGNSFHPVVYAPTISSGIEGTGEKLVIVIN